MLIYQIMILFVCHFIADFLLQSHWMAQQKSQKLEILLLHVWIHFAVFTFVFGILFDLKLGTEIAAINATLHAVIDWNIWRGFKRIRKNAGSEYKFYEDHWFYVVIGLDQLLHGLSMLLALKIVSGN